VRSPSQRAARLLVAAVASILAASFVDPASGLAAGAPAGLSFVVSPGGGPSNVPWTQQPVVRIVDANGETVTTSNLAVLLRRAATATGILFCNTNPVRAVEGVATFRGCWLDAPQSGATLVATAFELPPATSAPFDVGPPVDEPPARLAFDFAGQESPFTATAEGPIWFDVRVRVLDAAFRTITTGPLSTTPVTFSVAPNPAGATVSCPGGTTVTTVAGSAEFEDCSISKPAIGLSILASAPGLIDGVFNGIDVWPKGSPRGPRLSLFEGNPAPTWGVPLDFAVTVDEVPGGGSPANRVVHIQATDNPSDPDSWRTISDVTTGADGRGVFSGYTPRTNHWYRAAFDGAADIGPALSFLTRIVVRQKLLLRPASEQVRTVPLGTTIDVLTVVRPVLDTPSPGRIDVRILRVVNGVARGELMTLTADATGRATLPVTLDEIGSWDIRARVEPTSANANSYWTRPVRYRVR
jgi:hypothetical protein